MIRPKSSHRYTYKPVGSKKLPPTEHPAMMAARVVATTTCNRCGWPTGRSAIRDGWTPGGDYLYRHNVCPTTRERAELRRAALVEMGLA